MPIKRFRLNLFEYFSPKIGSAQLMPALQGCKISIFCDDKPLEEYSLEVLNENTATCWIPSEAGKNFAIHWKIDSESPLAPISKRLDCYIDGRAMRRPVRHQIHTEGIIDGALADKQSIRPFMFHLLNLTEDESLDLSSNVNPEQIGIISIKVHRVEVLETLSDDRYYDASKHVPGSVNEKSKKVGAHCVSLGPVKSGSYSVPIVSTKNLDSGPFITFNFHYRSKDLLQAMGLIPSTKKAGSSIGQAPRKNKGKKRKSDASSQPKANSKRVKEEINPDPDEDNEKVLQEQMEALQRRMDAIKASKMCKSPVKREDSPLRTRFAPDEIIDLT